MTVSTLTTAIFLVFSILVNPISAFPQTTGQQPLPLPPTPTMTSGDAPKDTAPTPISSSSTETPVLKTEDVRSAANSSSRYVSKTEPIRIPRLETPPTIDGQLDDAAWGGAAVFGDFLQTNPGDNVAPTHPTEVLMGYDAKYLYIAFKVIENRDKVRATVARRDNIFNDDYVGVHLDTFNDQRQAYILFFNPLGVQADGIFAEGRDDDYSVDIVMDSKGVLTSDGFTVEVAIPFKSLRYEAGKDKMWGIHIFRRFQDANKEMDSWMPINRSISSSLNQAGKITGLEDISTTRQLEINPSLTLSQTGRRSRYTFDNNPAGRYINDGLKTELGFTAKFSLTPTITLDFAYNPDFAQVEADAPVSTANQRFPIFFQEKRPFFLERIDIFQTPMNIVNTRAIIDPDIAAKITGRRGKNTFGILYASDNAPGNYSQDEREDLRICRQTRFTNPGAVCGIERFVDKNADIGVFRFKRDIGSQHNLGFFATTYNFTDRHNHTAGFDGRFRLDEKTIAEFQIVGTNSRRHFYDSELDSAFYRTGNGFGYSYMIDRIDRNWRMTLDGEGRTRDYRADVGFTPRVDTNQHRSRIRYQTDYDATKPIIFK
ncbi:MAG: carbohydrate binding family 9 domain-containing protein, partial [Acidobacteria bacterium]|nr:carbohydrate binding family 9 domain-containing protein [Acidobacteriota bacterium]